MVKELRKLATALYYALLGVPIVLLLVSYPSIALIVGIVLGGYLWFAAKDDQEMTIRRLGRVRPPDDGLGGASIPALVGAGPRGPRSAADAKSWPEV